MGSPLGRAAVGLAWCAAFGTWFLVAGGPGDSVGLDDQVGATGRRLESGGTPVYDIAHHEWGYSNSITSRDCTFLSFFVALLVVALVLGAWVSRRVSSLPEACVVLLVGVAAGVACKAIRGTTSGSHRHHFFTKPLLGFDNSLFFLGLLPPIIFRSGYELRPSWLVSLWGPILSLAVVGTLASALVVALAVFAWSGLGGGPGRRVAFSEALAFGALISASDPAPAPWRWRLPHARVLLLPPLRRRLTVAPLFPFGSPLPSRAE